MLTIASYIKTTKKYANNISISDEDFVRSLFEYVINELEIKNKKNEIYDFKKSLISEVLNQKEDVPTAIRNAVCKKGVLGRITQALGEFMDDYLNPIKIEMLIKELKEIIENDMTISNSAKEEMYSLDNKSFFARMFVEAVKVSNVILREEKKLWSSGDNSLSIIPGDIIKIAFESKKTEKKIVVIPVNTAFDTYLSTNSEVDLFPLVSEKTIHGKWLKNMLKLIERDELDERIKNYLSKALLQPVGKSEGSGGNTDKYPIGTTVIIQQEDTISYLLAISDFNSKNKAQSSKECIEKAVDKLLEYYDDLGLGYDLYVPLLGTGKSRAYLTPKESFELLRDSFLSKKHMINGKVGIVVLENTVAEIM